MIIFGGRQTSALLAVLYFHCAFCRAHAAQRLFRTRTWFTLFFLPIFPMGHGAYSIHCAYCGNACGVSRENADRFVADAHAQPQMAGPAPSAQTQH
ncbi:zinc-ribbon domain-containing protein [Streptomyces sp. SID6673]|nr:zinc-ribbon domain-containing protein [Streptomyces sp. SID11726]NEB25414.1 zinc-ribbon domain-containing protein [Streptomyces sp. SID6673]